MSEREPDSAIARTLEELMAALRGELEERLETYRSRLQNALTEALPKAPEPAAEEEDGALALVEAFRAIDAASSQSQILRTLLRRSLRFADRLALLLTPGGDYLVWGTEGFAPATNGPSEDSFAPPEEGPWHEALTGRGRVELSAGDCALLCDRLDCRLPDGGVLVPFILQGRLAALLYADQTPADALDTHRLSVLAWAAARAIEALPFRERPAVAMLRPLSEVATDEPAIPLWAPPEEVEAESEDSREPAVAEPEAGAAVEAETTVEGVVEEATAAEEEAAVAPAEEEEEIAAEEGHAPPEEDTEPMMTPWGTSTGVVEAAPEEAAETESAETEEISVEAEAATAEESTEAIVTEPEVTEPEVAEPPVVPAEEAATVEQAAPVEETATVEEAAPTPSTPTEPEPGPIMPEAEAERAPSSEFEVMPPRDVSGPGWAFTTSAASDDEEAFHAEAKRLARLLVSEIKLYHEVDVWEGRRKGNVYVELQGEIDRSRQLFDQRVDEEIRAKRDYFYEELVRQLADGNAEVLGI